MTQDPFRGSISARGLIIIGAVVVLTAIGMAFTTTGHQPTKVGEVTPTGCEHYEGPGTCQSRLAMGECRRLPLDQMALCRGMVVAQTAAARKYLAPSSNVLDADAKLHVITEDKSAASVPHYGDLVNFSTSGQDDENPLSHALWQRFNSHRTFLASLPPDGGR